MKRHLPVLQTDERKTVSPGKHVLLVGAATVLLWLPMLIIALRFGVWALCLSFALSAACGGLIAIRFLHSNPPRPRWRAIQGVSLAAVSIPLISLLGGVSVAQGLIASAALLIFGVAGAAIGCVAGARHTS